VPVHTEKEREREYLNQFSYVFYSENVTLSLYTYKRNSMKGVITQSIIVWRWLVDLQEAPEKFLGGLAQ
jgi:hypothetical protein